MSDSPALQCPYCTAGLPEAALRCPSCGQDVALIMPALRRLSAHEAAIGALRVELEALRQAGPPAPLQPAAPAAPPASNGLLRASLAAAISFLLLIAIHQAVVIQLDLPSLVLRVASIGVPCAVVLMLPGVAAASLGVLAGTGVMLGVTAVIGMSAAVAAVDGVPVFPPDARGQRELAEYAASMALAHFTGGAILRARRNLAASQSSHLNMTEKAANAQRLAEAALPVTTLLASIYAGILALRG